MATRNWYGKRIVPKEDKYTKYSRVKLTKSDEYLHYFKLFMILVVGYIYFHFVIMGWGL